MPITPKPVIEHESITARFPKDLVDELDSYCRFLGGATDRSYVIVEAVREEISKNREFQRSRRPQVPAVRNTDTSPRVAAPRPAGA